MSQSPRERRHQNLHNLGEGQVLCVAILVLDSQVTRVVVVISDGPNIDASVVRECLGHLGPNQSLAGRVIIVDDVL